MKLARSPPPPFAQPEQSRVANVTIPKSRVLALQVLRILRTKGFENFLIIFFTPFFSVHCPSSEWRVLSPDRANYISSKEP
jgi:hypothetical protein